jgi:hypothetical protein
MKEMGQSDYVIDINNLDGDQVIDRINALVGNKNQVQEHLNSCVNTVKAAAQRNIDLIHELSKSSQ